MAATLKGSLLQNLDRLLVIPTPKLLDLRYEKFRKIGVFEDGGGEL